jgi:hypothetical protein
LLFLVLLALVWAAVLLTPVMRSRSTASGDSISDFNYRLDVLAQTNGNGAAASRGNAPHVGPSAAQRRRTALLVLTSAVCATGLLALATPSTAAWALNVLADAALVAFLGLWAWIRSLQAEQAAKVREMPARHQPDFALRRVASS